MPWGGVPELQQEGEGDSDEDSESTFSVAGVASGLGWAGSFLPFLLTDCNLAFLQRGTWTRKACLH